MYHGRSPSASSPARAGIALLIVMGALVIITTLVGMGLRATWQTQAHLALHRDDIQRELLRLDGEAVALHFLDRAGADLATPSEAWWRGSVIVETVYAASHTSRHHDLHLRVLAWDAMAGVPLTKASRRARSALPEGLRAVPLSDGMPLPRVLTPTVPLPDGWQRYPADVWDEQSVTIGQTAPAACVALWISEFGTDAIHARTAPPELLAAVIEGRGRGQVLEALLAARDAGEPLAIPPDLARAHDGWPAVAMTTDRWQVSVTTDVNGRSSGWWNVVLGDGQELRIVSRHAIIKDADE